MAVDPFAMAVGVAFEEWQEAAAVEGDFGGQFCAGDVGERGEDISQVCEGIRDDAAADLWSADDAGDSRTQFSERAFAAPACPVVTDEDDERVAVELRFAEGIEQATDEGIEVFKIGAKPGGTPLPGFGGIRVSRCGP